MTPEEVFARLRDIHVPDTTAVSDTGMAPEPVLVFAALVAAIFAIRAVRQSRRAAARLAAVSPALEPAEQRDRIARVLRTAPRRKNADAVPPAFFAPPSRLNARDAETIRAWARRRLR